MHIDLITVVPGLLEGPFSHSILKRAEEKGIATVRIHNLRDYATGKQKQVDDYAFGGGAGMVLMIEPIARCIEALQKERVYDEIIYMTPDGETFDQPMANTLFPKEKPPDPLRSLQRSGSAGSGCLHHQGNQYRRLRPFRRRIGSCCSSRCPDSTDSRRTQRRDFGLDRFLPR